MNNRLYIGNRIIETTDELKELFGLEDMANPSSSLFSKLLDNVYDGVLQDFLRSNGEIDLAERVDGIDLNDSESSIMSRLISIMTNTEVSVSSNPIDYINVLSTTVELRENPLHFVAVFKVKVVKKDNRKTVLTIIQPPKSQKAFSLFGLGATFIRTQSASKNPFLGVESINAIKKVQENSQKAYEQGIQKVLEANRKMFGSIKKIIQQAPVTTMSELLSAKHETEGSSSTETKPTIVVHESTHCVDEKTQNKDNGQSDCIVETMELNLNQLQQDKIILFECEVEKNKDIIFKVDDDIVSEIAAKEMEQLAYQEAKKRDEINIYLELFPFGSHASELKDRKELQMYEGCTTMEKCEEYLKLYPQGHYYKEIKIRWLMFDIDHLEVRKKFLSEGPTGYALAKLFYLIMILVKMNGPNALNGLAVPLMEKEGVSEEAFTAECNQIEKLFDGHASSDYIYPRLVSSVIYRAVIQSVPSEVERLVEKNLKVVLSN